MSYCRFGAGSDVYLFADVQGGWSCCACRFKKDGSWGRFDSEEDTIAHLEAHQRAGHKVPAHAIGRLHQEIERRASSSTRTKDA